MATKNLCPSVFSVANLFNALHNTLNLLSRQTQTFLIPDSSRPQITNYEQRTTNNELKNARIFSVFFTQLFEYFQTFHTIFRIFSNVFKRFTSFFERFQTFSNVFERFRLAYLAQTPQLDKPTPVFTPKIRVICEICG